MGGNRRTEAKSVYEGIVTTIKDLGHEPTPVAFLGCTLTMLQNPSSDVLPHLLRFLLITLRKIDPAMLLAKHGAVLGVLSHVIRNYGNHAGQAFGCVKTVLNNVEVTASTLKVITHLEPSRLNIPVMRAYLTTLAALLRSLAKSHPELVTLELPELLRRWCSVFQGDVPAELAAHGARELKLALSVCLQKELIDAAQERAQFEQTPMQAPQLDAIVSLAEEEDDAAAMRSMEMEVDAGESSAPTGLGMSLAGRTPHAIDFTIDIILNALMGQQYRGHWHLIADVAATVLKRLGSYRNTFPGLKKIVLRLDAMMLQSQHAEDAKMKQLHNNAGKALAEAVRTFGCEEFINLLPFDINNAIPPWEAAAKAEYQPRRGPVGPAATAARRAEYVLPLLARHVSHDRLAFFQTYFLPLADKCKQQLLRARHDQMEVAAASWEWRWESVWNLLPGFCTFPKDLSSPLLEAIGKRMLAESKDNHKIRTSVCKGFLLLIHKNQQLAEAPTREEREDAEAVEAAEFEEGEEEMDMEGDGESQAGTATTGTSAPTAAPTFMSTPSATTANQGLLEERGLPADMDEEDAELAEEDPHAFHSLTRDQAKANLAIMTRACTGLLPGLCNMYEHTATDKRGHILDTIHACVKIATPEVRAKVFNVAAQKLTAYVNNTAKPTSQEQLHSEMNVMCDIATAMCDTIEGNELNTLTALLPNLITYNDVGVQKKSYRILERLLYHRREHMEPHLEKITQILLSNQTECPPACRHSRLKCFLNIFSIIFADYTTISAAVANGESGKAAQQKLKATRARVEVFLDKVVLEILLSTREFSAKARAVAHHALLAMAAHHRTMHEDKITPFAAKLVEIHVGAQSIQASSCAITALGRLLYEYSRDLTVQEQNEIIQSIVPAMTHAQAEQHNAAFDAVKLILKTCSRNKEFGEVVRQNILPQIMAGVIHWSSQGRAGGMSRFKLHAITERCIRRFGFEAVEPLVPEAHRRFVQYVNRELLKAERKKKRDHKREVKTKAKQEQMAKLGLRKQKKKEKQSSKGLGLSLTKEEEGPEGEEDDGYTLRFDAGGQLLITAKEEEAEEAKAAKAQGLPGSAAAEKAGKGNWKGKGKPPVQGQITAGLPGVLMPKGDTHSLRLKDRKQRKRKQEEALSKTIQTGEQFKSKKGQGDVLKGEVEPFAYIPLNKAFLNPRMKKLEKTRFKSVTGKAEKKPTGGQGATTQKQKQQKQQQKSGQKSTKRARR